MNQKQTTSTIILVVSAIAGLLVASGELPADYMAIPAFIVGIGIVLAAAVESQGNVRNIIRADWIAIVAIYGLTLAEFLSEQPDFNTRSNPEEAARALWLFTLGFIGLAVGRHWYSSKSNPGFKISMLEPKLVLKIFFLASFLGFSAELLAVRFNPIELIDAQMGPRFSQPWGRGKIGGLYSLLYELGLFKYGILPLAGVLINARREIGTTSLFIVLAIGVFTLFFAFCSGTRNVFAAYLAGLAGAYLLTLPNLTKFRLTVVGALTAVVFVAGSFYMLEFRGMGLKRFLNSYETIEISETYYVDYNMWAIGKIGLLFPDTYPHIGMELYWHAATKPIPRVLWPGKPVELSTSIEGALDVEGLTIATTFIGESYMAYGELGVLGTGLFLGACCGWWNYMGTRMPGAYGQLVYASGFAAIAIAMRSLMFFTTNMLPTIGLVVLGLWLSRKMKTQFTSETRTPSEPRLHQ